MIEDKKEKNEGNQLILALVNQGKIVRLNGQVYMERERLDEITDLIKDIITKEGSITLAQLRDSLGTSRKYAMAILDYTDDMKLTKMVEE